MKRFSTQKRKTKETDISLVLVIDGNGEFTGSSGVGFFDHMLASFSHHGNFNLNLDCTGDLHVDSHHTVEDIGIVLGKAFSEACGDLSGIRRFSDSYMPMDESLVLSALDISGRSFLHYDVCLPSSSIGTFDLQLVKEFFLAFTRHFPITLHIKLIHGENHHHIIEAVFKSVALSLKKALSITGGTIPSLKGTL